MMQYYSSFLGHQNSGCGEDSYGDGDIGEYGSHPTKSLNTQGQESSSKIMDYGVQILSASIGGRSPDMQQASNHEIDMHQD